MTLQYTVQEFDDLNEVKMSRAKNHIFLQNNNMILDNNHKMYALIVLLIAC